MESKILIIYTIYQGLTIIKEGIKHMDKIILMPDSFKGTMSAQQVCNIMEEKILEHFKKAEIIKIPIADGGEGSVDCFLEALGGKKKYVEVCGVFGENMTSYYGLLSDKKTAVVEMAACAGLPLAGDNLNPLKATTYGVGQLILAAAKEGATEIILGLGGSATNDGGCGAAAAMGVKFYNSLEKEFVPTGENLKNICKIDVSKIDPAIKKVKLTAMCDIDNPMFGENGAAYVFAPQKGASASEVEYLDRGLYNLCKVIKKDIKVDVSNLPGGGAAGAMGAGMYAMLNAELKMGIHTVLDVVDFEKHLKGADIVFTGEGRLDGQSLRGKVVAGISQRASKKNVPVVAIVGEIGESANKLYDIGLSAVFSINIAAKDFSVSKHNSKENLAITMDNLMRYTKLI